MMYEHTKKWTVVALNTVCPMLHAAAYCLSSAGKKIRDYVGEVPSSILFEYKNMNCRMAYDYEIYLKFSRKLLEKLNEREFFNEINEKEREAIKASMDLAEKIFNENVSKLSDRELVERYEQVFDAYWEMDFWGHIINISDSDHFMLTNKLNEIIKSKNKKVNVNYVVATLITPYESEPLREQEENFFKILSLMQQGKDVKNEIREHTKKYDWMLYNFDGPTILDENYFKESLESELRQGTDAKFKLKERGNKLQDLKRKSDNFIKILGLNENEKYWFEVAKNFMYIKALRKDTLFICSRKLDLFIKEVALRLHISPIQLKHMSMDEFNSAFRGDKIDLDEINSRINYSAWICEDDKLYVFSGNDAKKYSSLIYEETGEKDTREFKGSPACMGKARGIVKLVETVNDLPKFKEGDILVSASTNPHLMPAIKKAAGIITDTGGVTCHAAVVSRELNIPCVIGTKIATKVLKDGDLVELDADNGIIKKIK
ncbi:MAG: PEP-utilizing enzyme [Candidatus Nanoarchaeia archaeon]|nr:PEP-utilizing enzyme [Candidatus Nanoarchaeia archaeon]